MRESRPYGPSGAVSNDRPYRTETTFALQLTASYHSRRARQGSAFSAMTAALRSLNDDQVAELLALVWLGRGDFDKDTWGEALAEAQVTRNERAVRYLVGTPLLGDLIEEGLAQLGRPLPEW